MYNNVPHRRLTVYARIHTKTSVHKYIVAYLPPYLSMATKRLFDYNELLVLIFKHDEMYKIYF